MIGPNMGTMLALIMTDAALRMSDAQAALVDAVDESFHCISVDGHMSTNDTVILLANGAAHVGESLRDSHSRLGETRPLEGKALADFRTTLLEVCEDLAQSIPADGEGATHLVTVEVHGCRTRADALQISKTIADSPLVKTRFVDRDSGLPLFESKVLDLPNVRKTLPDFSRYDLVLIADFGHGLLDARGLNEAIAGKSGAFVAAMAAMSVTLSDDSGKVLGEAKGEVILGNPLNAAVWLAKDLAESGKRIKAGDLLSLGSFKMETPIPGRTYTARYVGLPGGEIQASARLAGE